MIQRDHSTYGAHSEEDINVELVEFQIYFPWRNRATSLRGKVRPFCDGNELPLM